MSAPPPRTPGAEWLSIDVDDAAIDGVVQAAIDLEDFSAGIGGAQDIIIADTGTEALTSLTIETLRDGSDMPVTLSFWGNQVGTLSSTDDDGNGGTILDIGAMPFLATDLIIVTFSDASFDANGEFLPFGDIIYTDVQVVRDGVIHDLSVDSGSKVKESGGGTNEHQGDSFFHTDDSIGPAASGPFASIPDDQYAFLAGGTLSVGDSNVIPRVTGTEGNAVFDGTNASTGSMPLNEVDGAPPPRDGGTEWLSVDVDDAEIDASGEAIIDISDIATGTNSSQDVIINDTGTEALTRLEIDGLGGNGDADIIRLDLTTFDDDFALIILGASDGDQLVLSGVDSVVYHPDLTQTITYTGSDGEVHVMTISDDIPFEQVLHYPPIDGGIDGTSEDEAITDGFADYAGDQVDHASDNTIFGHGGSDTITGGDGADVIYGDYALPEGTLATDLSQPDPQAEQLTFSITDTDIDKKGEVDVVVDALTGDVDGQEDVVIVDSGTEAITSIHISKMGKGDDEQDVFRFDLSTFDDDFTITVMSEGTEDRFVFSNGQSIVDNGDGTSTITYIGSDSSTHTVTLESGLAEIEFYNGPVSTEFDDVIDAGTGDDLADGGFGQDSIEGGAGDDTLIGNVGSDTLEGGAGDDVLHGDFSGPLEILPTRDPLPWSEDVSIGITDADIDDQDGTVEYKIEDLVANADLSQDVTITDGGTEAISEVVVKKLGGDEVDVIRLDLTGFDDDFDFIVENVGSEDVVIFTGVDSVVDNGDGTQTLTYTGSDDQVHTVVVDANAAQVEITYTSIDETPFADDNDVLDGGDGDDTIDGGYGDDTIIASTGNDVISGGDGTDTYDVASSTTLTDEAITVTVGTDGDGTVVKNVDGTTDTISEMEHFVADENAGSDEITVTDNVLNTEVTGLEGDEIGIFTPDSGAPISFGGPGEPTLGEILSGTYVPLGETEPVDPNGDYVVYGDDLDFEVGAISFENFETVNFSVGDPVCFARGTHLLTKAGEVPVEQLQPGDELLTWDNGYQPIRWIGKSRMLAQGASAPVRIAKGILGNVRDLWISQQHRILVAGWQVQLLYGNAEMFAPAKALANGGTVQICDGGFVDFYHVLLDRHEILYSEGILSESFYPGDTGLGTVSDASRASLFAVQPQLRSNPRVFGPTVRECLTVKEGQLLADTLPMLRETFFLKPIAGSDARGRARVPMAAAMA